MARASAIPRLTKALLIPAPEPSPPPAACVPAPLFCVWPPAWPPVLLLAVLLPVLFEALLPDCLPADWLPQSEDLSEFQFV